MTKLLGSRSLPVDHLSFVGNVRENFDGVRKTFLRAEDGNPTFSFKNLDSRIDGPVAPYL